MNREELEEIINTYKWISVRKFNPQDYDDWVDAYYALEEHHKDETEFLIMKCRKLAEELLNKINNE